MDVVPVHEYRDNKRMDTVVAYRYIVALPELRLEKIGVKIEGRQLLDKPEIEHGDYDNVLYPFAALSWDVGELISPIIYTKDNWRKMSFTPFYKNVEQDGIVLA